MAGDMGRMAIDFRWRPGLTAFSTKLRDFLRAWSIGSRKPGSRCHSPSVAGRLAGRHGPATRPRLRVLPPRRRAGEIPGDLDGAGEARSRWACLADRRAVDERRRRDYSSTQGQIVFVPDHGFFPVDRVTVSEWAHRCFAEAPLPPWHGGFRPEPAHQRDQRELMARSAGCRQPLPRAKRADRRATSTSRSNRWLRLLDGQAIQPHREWIIAP